MWHSKENVSSRVSDTTSPSIKTIFCLQKTILESKCIICVTNDKVCRFDKYNREKVDHYFFRMAKCYSIDFICVLMVKDYTKFGLVNNIFSCY